MRVNDIRLTEHFSLREFECRCCKRVKLHPALVAKLQKLRKMWQRPLVLTSGYRCALHNAEVGGALRSKHLTGSAADICVMARDQTYFRLLALSCGFSKVLLYEDRNFAHVEV